MEDASDTIANAIISINPELPSDFVEVDDVENKTLQMSCGTKGGHHYNFKVQITGNAELRVLPKSFRKID
jgi:hypothetical protein